MVLKRLPAPAIMLALWLLSSRPLHLPDMGVSHLDKVAHFIAYTVLALAISLWPGEKWWIGIHGRVITFYKFRTMVKNAKALKAEHMKFNERPAGPLFKMGNDPCITPIGSA